MHTTYVVHYNCIHVGEIFREIRGRKLTENTKFHAVEAHEVKPGDILIEAPSETWLGKHFQAAHLVTKITDANEIVSISTHQPHEPLNLTETPVAIIKEGGTAGNWEQYSKAVEAVVEYSEELFNITSELDSLRNLFHNIKSWREKFTPSIPLTYGEYESLVASHTQLLDTVETAIEYADKHFIPTIQHLCSTELDGISERQQKQYTPPVTVVGGGMTKNDKVAKAFESLKHGSYLAIKLDNTDGEIDYCIAKFEGVKGNIRKFAHLKFHNGEIDGDIAFGRKNLYSSRRTLHVDGLEKKVGVIFLTPTKSYKSALEYVEVMDVQVRLMHSFDSAMLFCPNSLWKDSLKAVTRNKALMERKAHEDNTYDGWTSDMFLCAIPETYGKLTEIAGKLRAVTPLLEQMNHANHKLQPEQRQPSIE
jgi:hypothetical protein